MSNTVKSSFIGYYLEPSTELVPLWQKFFRSKDIDLVQHEKLENSIDRNEKKYDFYLIDEEVYFKSLNNLPLLTNIDKPVFLLSDYVDSQLLKDCLTSGVKNCFDRGTHLKEVYDEIIAVIKDKGSRDYAEDVDNRFWLSWEEIKTSEEISHIADLSTLKRFKLMEEVYTNEFFRAEGNLTVLAENLDRITRVTARKYYNQFQRQIFSLLIEHFPHQENVPFLRLDRSKFISAMKKQWFFDDFKSFLEIYDSDMAVLEKIMKIPSEKIRLFNLYWHDLML